jgi:hypothetical protein
VRNAGSSNDGRRRVRGGRCRWRANYSRIEGNWIQGNFTEAHRPGLAHGRWG